MLPDSAIRPTDNLPGGSFATVFLEYFAELEAYPDPRSSVAIAVLGNAIDRIYRIEPVRFF